MRMDRLTSKFQMAWATPRVSRWARPSVHRTGTPVDGIARPGGRHVRHLLAQPDVNVNQLLDPVIGRDDEIRRSIQVLQAAPRTTRC